MMLLNLVLALAFAALTGRFGAADLAFGFALGFALIWLLREPLGAADYLRRAPRALRLAGRFAVELVLANVRVARHVLGPLRRLRPGIVAVPLDLESDAEIATFANLITLTPGTLSLDVSDDRRTLYVHGIDVVDPEAFRRGLKQGFERLVREAYRR